MITPGEISDELIRKAEAECEYNVGAWDVADPKEIVAAILNAAIEAGVVSPPCWEVVGEALNTVTVFKRQEDAREWAEVDNYFRKVEVRHWKGYAE